MTSTLSATTPTEAIEEDPLLLYEPLRERINPKKIPWTITYERVTARQAQKWLNDAAEYRGFGQRTRTPAAVARWRDLIQTNRFVEYLPLGGLCFNEDGIIMNGGNRLVAQVELGLTLGYTIIRDCPTWMLPYFDNGKMRTAKEARQIMLRDSRPDAQNIIKLAMRYEEFLFGKRGTLGWVNWSRQRDEHVDIENFERKRGELLDYLERGKKLRVKLSSNYHVAAGACFIFYQQLAWPEGSEVLEQFLRRSHARSEPHQGQPGACAAGVGSHGRLHRRRHPRSARRTSPAAVPALPDVR